MEIYIQNRIFSVFFLIFQMKEEKLNISFISNYITPMPIILLMLIYLSSILQVWLPDPSSLIQLKSLKIPQYTYKAEKATLK